MFHLSAAKDALAERTGKISHAGVLRILFEADVFQKLDASARARELYQRADPSGTCPERLVSAYLATNGYGERLFLEMEAARNGDMPALRAAMDRLYLDGSSQPGNPLLALELYDAAKKANPKHSLPGEAEIVDLLKMAVAAGPFDLDAFLNQHNVTERGPYFLWKLAEEASVNGRFGKPDSELVLQLVVRGSGSLSERLSAVRAAYTNWAGKGEARFEYKSHLKSVEGAASEKKEEYELRDEERERAFQARFQRLETVFKDPRVLSMDLKGVPDVASSEDGKLRIVSWDTQTGGTMHNYCSLAQFKSPDGKAGYALLQHPDQNGSGTPAHIFGEVQGIDTLAFGANETVYLVWTSSRVSTRTFSECVTAVSLKDGKVDNHPFFKTKRTLLSEIQFESRVQDNGERPEFEFSKTNGHILLVPIISERGDFSGKFFKYIFDGKRFGYSGTR